MQHFLRNFIILLFVALSIGFVHAQTESTWNGYRMLEFVHEGNHAKIVFPDKPDSGLNWIWRARFWGHEPQTDLALLKKGFHLVYIDVADLYGAPKAVDIWNRFYDFALSNYHLNPKVVLEGFSRGGLIVYNWAAENPDKVACIYADAPVCDINSWPGGKGRGPGSEGDWQKCLQAYGISETEAGNFEGTPVHTAKIVAREKIPVLHVCGTADEIVPIEENSYRIEKIFADFGSDFKMIEKQGVGHHPHSLVNPRAIVRFILENTSPDLLTEELTASVPRSVVFRQNLGNFQNRLKSAKKVRVAFLGGSITYNGGWRDSTMIYLRDQFPASDFQFISAGIPSMGSVPGAFRLQKDVLAEGKIDLLFVEAAVNDATNGRSAKAQIRGMEGIVRQSMLANPAMDIIMMHFVDPDKMSDYNQGKTPEVIIQHEKVASHYKITSINLAKEVNDRILNGEFTWRHDFVDLHPSPFGQEIYAKTIVWTLEKMLNPQEGVWSAKMIPTRPLDPYSYFNGHFLTIKKSKKRRNWDLEKAWHPQDTAATRKGFVEVPALVTESPGAIFSLKFKGKAIGILVAAGPDAGIIEYSVDGSYYKEVDLYTKWSNWLHLPWLYVLEDELRNDDHHLVIRMTKNRNKGSTGTACRIFAFAVN
ncbi:MAG: prolyl oligopeptidase family serine peptidase [Saprospiraceae bacterium]|nr:prolyl oligopeptidase family serine peptidase [Saprospiraceae bacterium]